jgi:hypothetical protein
MAGKLMPRKAAERVLRQLFKGTVLDEESHAVMMGGDLEKAKAIFDDHLRKCRAARADARNIVQFWPAGERLATLLEDLFALGVQIYENQFQWSKVVHQTDSYEQDFIERYRGYVMRNRLLGEKAAQKEAELDTLLSAEVGINLEKIVG